jgi:hypothetical protein
MVKAPEVEVPGRKAHKPVLTTTLRVPHITLVFRGMWDTTAPTLSLRLDDSSSGERTVVSHTAKNKRDMGHPKCCRQGKGGGS